MIVKNSPKCAQQGKTTGRWQKERKYSNREGDPGGGGFFLSKRNKAAAWQAERSPRWGICLENHVKVLKESKQGKSEQGGRPLSVFLSFL